MKTLITGGTGFIGHALIKSLLDQDHQITVRWMILRCMSSKHFGLLAAWFKRQISSLGCVISRNFMPTNCRNMQIHMINDIVPE